MLQTSNIYVWMNVCMGIAKLMYTCEKKYNNCA